jgi:uncharacterized protein involved in type VI secretion and phage assembly
MTGSQEQILDVLERLRNRFYGKYRGTVTAVDAGTFRIKAKVPAVLQDQDSGWCMPCVPYAGDDVGFVFLPEVGTGVWIEFEGGDVSYPIWTGCYWRTDEQPSDAGPAVKAIITKASHKILLDDDGETITVSDQKQNQITLDSSGVSVERGGKKVVVSDAEVNVNDGAWAVT